MPQQTTVAAVFTMPDTHQVHMASALLDVSVQEPSGSRDDMTLPSI
jgi:hypothetical protein